MRRIALFVAGFALAGCAASGPQRVDQTGPTVTYRYYGDPYGEQLDDVGRQAYDWCGRHYGRRARLRNVGRDGDANYAVFECA